MKGMKPQLEFGEELQIMYFKPSTEDRSLKTIAHFFTLIELVVSMSVLAVLMMIMMSFFSSAQQAWTSSSARSQVYDNARLAMDLMSRDLQSAVYEKDITPFWHRDRGGTLANERLYFISATSILPNDDCTTSNAEVAYELGDGTYEGWLRRSVTGNKLSGGSDNIIWNYPALVYPNNFGVGNTGLANNSFTADSTSTDSFQKVIPYVTNLYFRCFRKDGTEITPDAIGSKDTEFPSLVTINLTLMDRTSWQKWKALGGQPQNIYWDHPTNKLIDTDSQSVFRKLHERNFTKMVFLGERGQ